MSEMVLWIYRFSLKSLPMQQKWFQTKRWIQYPQKTLIIFSSFKLRMVLSWQVVDWVVAWFLVPLISYCNNKTTQVFLVSSKCPVLLNPLICTCSCHWNDNHVCFLHCHRTAAPPPQKMFEKSHLSSLSCSQRLHVIGLHFYNRIV